MPDSGVSWGVLGTGMVARRAILPALRRMPDIRLLGVASRDAARATACAAEFGLPRAYAGYAALLDDPEIACVHLALPNALHREWAVRAAAAGKHVLCEKPLGCSVAAVDAMVVAAAGAGVHLMEALMYRFHPRTARLHALLAEGAIGEVRGVQAAFSFPLADRDTYRTRPELGGGALLDVGGYCVSAVLALLSGAPRTIYATAEYGPTGIDESLSGLLDFGDGRTAQILCGFRAAEHQRLTVIGTTGVLDVPHAFTAWHDDPAPLLLQRGTAVEVIPGAPADPYQLMLERFSAAVAADEPTPYSLAESRATARVLEALARAARTGAPVTE